MDRSAVGESTVCDTCTQCKVSVANAGEELREARARLVVLEKKVKEQGQALTQQKFRLASMEGDDDKIAFYSGLLWQIGVLTLRRILYCMASALTSLLFYVEKSS